MSVVSCSNCGMKVVPAGDGACPSCRHQMSHVGGEVTVAQPQAKPRATFDGVTQSIPTHFDLIWLLFSVRGRLSLGLFWCAAIFTAVLWFGAFRLVYWLFIVLPPVMIVLTRLIFLLACWTTVALGAKRFHDLGLPGWLVVPGLLIPGAGPFFLFVTIFGLKGERGPNRYGMDPRRIWSAGWIDEQ